MSSKKLVALVATLLLTLNLGAQEYTSTYDFILKDSTVQTTVDDSQQKKVKKPKLPKNERQAAKAAKEEEERQYREWRREQRLKEARLRDTLKEEARQNREWLEIAEREARMEQAQLRKSMKSPSSKRVEGHVECDFLSQYLWRGIEKGGISIQPRARVEWRGLSLQLSGSTGLESKDNKEINATIGYHLGGFNIGVTDYWTSGQDYKGRDLYFYFDPQATAHQVEANLGFSCPYFSLQGYTMLVGRDFKYDSVLDALYNVNGKRAYSTYVELNIPFYMGGLDWDLTGGVTPFESAGKPVNTDDGIVREYFYAKGFACVKASLRATKNFELGDIKMPIFAEIHTNPYMQKAWLVVGVRVLPFK